MTDRLNKNRLPLLQEASDDYESWKWGDPALTREQVTATYIEAERAARAMDRRLGTHNGWHSVNCRRLEQLGIDPATLEPLNQSE